jgi:hypothetical protein
MTHLSIQWGWVGGGGGKSQETSEVQKRVGQQQQQPRISEEKLLSTAAAEQSRVLCIVSFSFCVHPPNNCNRHQRIFHSLPFSNSFWEGGIIIPRHYSCLSFSPLLYSHSRSHYTRHISYFVLKKKDLGRV